MREFTRAVLVCGVCLLVSACGLSWFRDRSNDYLKSQDDPRTQIPSSLDAPTFTDLMPIPPVVDSRGISGQKFELPMPDAMNASYGVDRIVIKKLGDKHWISVDAAPATVWPRLFEFWASNNLDLETADPSRGLIETVWLPAAAGDADKVFDSLKQRSAQSSGGNVINNRFQLRITPGVRTGSSEIHLRYKAAPAGGSANLVPDWSQPSDNLAIEDTVLSAVAYFLGETINDETRVSLLASTIAGESLAILVPDKEKPVLKYKLDLNRAWLTVGSALEDAKIRVQDRDRSSGIYYVDYDALGGNRPGFISRLFRGKDARSEGLENRYLVQLSEVSDGVDVTVFREPASLARADVAERLLMLIKDFSS